MNILLVAGTGLLGTILARRLVAEGHTVWALAVEPAATTSSCQPSMLYVQADRNDSREMLVAITNGGIAWDLVVDVAAYSPEQARVLSSILADRRPRAIVISTVFVYDPAAPLPLTSRSAVGDESVLGGYAFRKLLMENVWREAWERSRQPSIILRLPHVLAPGCELGPIPLHNRDPQLVARVKAGQPLFLADGGEQLLNVVSADDVAEVVVRCARLAWSGSLTFNVANPDILSARCYLEAVSSVLKLPPLSIVSVPSESVRRSQWGWDLSTISRLCDMSELGSFVGFVPNTPLREALRPCVESCLLRPSSLVLGSDPFAALCDLLQRQRHDLSHELSELSSRRHPMPIDDRMNLLPRPRLT